MKDAHALILASVALAGISLVFMVIRPERALSNILESKFDAIGGRQLIFGQNDLRVAVFGGGTACGAGLGSRFKAYPYLLSPTVDNFAHSSMGPNYFSVCTETIVGDEPLYDVIILDYWLKYSEGLEPLTFRLRQRYPNAILILIRNWQPIHFRRKETEDSQESQGMAQWKRENGLDDADVNTIIKAIEKDTGYWYLPTREHADAAVWQIARKVKGYEFSFTERETGKQTLIEYLGYFEEKSHTHLSESGHEAMAKSLKHVLKSHLENGDASELVNSGLFGDWGRGDDCNLWYFSGATTMEHGGMQMRQFDEKNGFFALEVTEPGWIVICNELKHGALPTRTLFVSFLTSKEDDYYPNAEVSVGDSIWSLRTLNNMDPKHAVRTVALGQFAEECTNMTVTTIGNAQYPFRLVGFSFSDEVTTPLEWAFGPTHGN